MTHTDIKAYQWIEHLPERARPYVLLARLDRPIGIWLLLLPGWWAITLAAGGVRLMNAHDWEVFILFGIGAVVMRAAGCVINDLWDRELDGKVERTKLRPLASGVVSVKEALFFLAGLLLFGFFILLQMNFVTILLGFLSLPLVISYPLMKRYTWWPQAFLGITFNFGALMGWSAITGTVGIASLLLYAGGIAWTLAYDTIYAQQDAEDDALAGMKSSALRLGDDTAKAMTVFFAVAWLLIVAGGITGGHHLIVLLLMIPALAQLGWQLAAWDKNDAASSLKIFRSNRDFGILVLAAMALS